MNCVHGRRMNLIVFYELNIKQQIYYIAKMDLFYSMFTLPLKFSLNVW